MIEWILMKLTGRATVNLDAVAKTLADAVLDEFGDVQLDPASTNQLLRTRYMRAVTRWGLPAGACNEAATRAWRMIAQAQELPPEVAATFTFYD